MTTPTTPAPTPNKITRRHDLDALRAFAMLLGIALHATISFMPIPAGIWPIQDIHQHEAFTWFMAAIHGFRMPLFFVVSGFFTAMLWRKRGLRALLAHRFRRIFLPLALGMVTVVPAVLITSIFASVAAPQRNTQPTHTADASTNIWTAACFGDTEAIAQHFGAGTPLDLQNPKDGTTSLTYAAMFGHPKAVAYLLDQGADVNTKNRAGGTALLTPVFFGRTKITKMLLENNADITIANNDGVTPIDALQIDWRTTQYIAHQIKIELNKKQLLANREEIAQLFASNAPKHASTILAKTNKEKRPGPLELATTYPVFHHLWFLWFLCWLVLGFALYARIADRLQWKGPPKWLVLSPARFLWLLPLTLIPQATMGLRAPTFGPDTSVGLLPVPQILLYYAIFFGFGALYYDCPDDTGRVGRRWRLTLPLALLIIFPLAYEFTTGKFGFRDTLLVPEYHRTLAVTLQVLYTWTMTFALIGIFRDLLPRENKTIRYLSDASYWLYLAHLPLIILAQFYLQQIQAPAPIKFTLICLLVTTILLITYRYSVRYTWLGTLLNGKRTRPGKST